MSVKAIIIGPSLSGKTTLARYLRENTSLPVLEIDEELTRLNNGEYPADDRYKHELLAPQVVDGVLKKDSILFFTNTDYFTPDDLKTARNKGFKILQLSLNLEELKRRNKSRVENEGYSDLSEWLEGMVEYQTEIKESGLVDLELDANETTKMIAQKILSLSQLNYA